MIGLDPRLGRMLALSDKSFDVATIENAGELISFAEGHGLPPVEVDEGYWSTVRVFWPRLEVEVFDDHLEFYPDGDGTRVWYLDHRPGEGFPDGLIATLRQDGRADAKSER